MESTIPLNDFYALIRPSLIPALCQVRTAAVSGNGDAAYPSPPAIVHAFQSLLGEMPIDTLCFRRFAEIDLIDGRIPDEATILIFRNFLEEHQIAEEVLDCVNQSLSEKALLRKQGAILDATIINTPSSTKNKQKVRNPEIYSVAKGNHWFFGRLCHSRFAEAMGHDVDADSVLVHSVVSTAAESVNGALIYCDSTHIGIEKHAENSD